MAFCPRCGGPVTRRVPPGDHAPREVCDACGAVHYQNPRMVVGTAVERGDEVLLCRRAIEPRRGAWTLPAGFLELGESATEGACRETLEETGVEATIVGPLVHFDIARIGQIFVIFRARQSRPELELPVASTSESLEIRWFARHAIPWDELAFDATRYALEHLVADHADGVTRLHYATLRARAPGVTGPWQSTIEADRWSVPLAG